MTDHNARIVRCNDGKTYLLREDNFIPLPPDVTTAIAEYRATSIPPSSDVVPTVTPVVRPDNGFGEYLKIILGLSAFGLTLAFAVRLLYPPVPPVPPAPPAPVIIRPPDVNENCVAFCGNGG